MRHIQKNDLLHERFPPPPFVVFLCCPDCLWKMENLWEKLALSAGCQAACISLACSLLGPTADLFSTLNPWITLIIFNVIILKH